MRMSESFEIFEVEFEFDDHVICTEANAKRKQQPFCPLLRWSLVNLCFPTPCQVELRTLHFLHKTTLNRRLLPAATGHTLRTRAQSWFGSRNSVREEQKDNIRKQCTMSTTSCQALYQQQVQTFHALVNLCLAVSVGVGGQGHICDFRL